MMNVAELTQPISEEVPSGAMLGASHPLFDQLKWEFGRARDAERKLREYMIATAGGDDTTGMAVPEPPAWSRVVSLAEQILQSESKDLRVAAWLTEGLIRTRGFAGLLEGLQLFYQLCNQYWDTIHPRPNEDGHADALAQFAGLVGEASIPAISEIPITSSKQGEKWTSIHYAEAAELESIGDEGQRQKRIDRGAVTLSQIEAAARNTDGTFYLQLRQTLLNIETTLSQLSDFLDDHCLPTADGEPTAPSVAPMKEKIASIRRIIEGLAKHHFEKAGQPVGDVADDGLAATSEAKFAGVEGPITSRDHAFEVIRRVAEFFERTEPHSPISFTLRKVISWGQMSLPELLQELIDDRNVLARLSKRIGLGSIEGEDDE